MLKRHVLLFCFLLVVLSSVSQTKIEDSKTQSPISFATISFGNGNGVFADDNGSFLFTKKIYPDIDTLYISALGYKELKIATLNLPKTLFLEAQADELQEIIVQTKINRKFKVEKRKPKVHNDYFKCWLPTIESEIAVFFPNTTPQTKKITTVFFPIKIEASDWKERKRSGAKKRPFSTLFRVQFYNSDKRGLPGDVLSYENIIFRVTEQNKDVFELDVTDYDIYVPKNGVFVSIQVLGYTDKAGKLLPNKKYKEIKSKNGIVKIPTNFRPLLPFTEEIPENRTYVKRVFINGNYWLRHEKESQTKPSSLLKSGINNYGIGMHLNVYKDE